MSKRDSRTCDRTPMELDSSTDRSAATRRVRRTLFLLLITLVAFPLSGADDEIPATPESRLGSPGTLRAFRVENDEVRIDGVLDESVWARAEPLKIGWETWPADNEPAKANAEGWVAYDESNLYIAFKAYDPDPRQIRARYTDRDRAFQDDFVGVSLDTFNDERRAFCFYVNPLGVQMDTTLDDVGGGEDSSWDALWDSAGRITEFGYTVEMAIPFSSLRFDRDDAMQTWGIDMIRIYPRDQRYNIRSQHLNSDLSCYLCQVSKLDGLSGLEQGKGIELVPTVTAQRTDMDEGSGIESGSVDTQLGLSGKWGFTTNLTLNAALNPDFSQVEADAAQLDVNNQFALFFPEKRPFFLEGSDFFNTPVNAVYTRTVADPDWGVKVTGKEGASAIGAYVARDSVSNLLIPGSQRSSLTAIEEETLATVLRYRYDLGENSTLGVLYTGREGAGDYSNRAGGFDAYWRFGEADTFIGQVLASSTRYPDEIVEDYDQPSGSFDDVAFTLAYRHDDRNWRWRAEYEDIGTDFRSDSGFLPRVDYRKASVTAERKFIGDSETSWSRASLGADIDFTEDQSGQSLETEYELWFGVNLPKQTFINITGMSRERFFNGETFDEYTAIFYGETQPKASFSMWMRAQFGDQTDFANTQLGEYLEVSPGVTWRPGNRTEVDLSHRYSTMDVEGGRLFEANQTELRAVYQVNLRMFVRAILQYTDIKRNPALYRDEVDARTEHLFPQILFSYKLNPQTVFFFGYSDNRMADDANPDLTQQDRTLFTKIGYAWVF